MTVTDVEEMVEDALAEPLPCEGWDEVEVKRFLGLLKTTEHYDCDDVAVAMVTYRCACPGCLASETFTIPLCGYHVEDFQHAAEHGEIVLLSVVPIGGAA